MKTEGKMERINIGSATINDTVSGEHNYFCVDVFRDSIGIGISEESNGDAEIFFDVKMCESIIEWLKTAKEHILRSQKNES